MSHLTQKKALFIIALIIILLSGLIRVGQVINYNFPFTTDQARDMLDLRNIVVGINPTLVGPTTSINGVFLGPGYYYFNVIPFFLGQGDPSYLVYWNILFYLIAALVILIAHYKKEVSFGFFGSIIFIMAPGFFQPTRYFWNANSMPYFSLFYFISLAFFLLQPSAKKAFLVGLLAGVGMQFEAAFGVLFLPFALLCTAIKKAGWRNAGIQLLSFGITLIPQILFDLKNNFAMSKLFIAELSGHGTVLGEKLTFFESVVSHFNSFILFSHGNLALPFNLGSVILIGSLFFLGLKLYQKKLDPVLKIYTLMSAGFLLFAFIVYLIYLHDLKDWYIYSLRLPYLFILTAFFSSVYQHTLDYDKTFLSINFKKLKHLPQTTVIVVILISVFFSYLDQKQFIHTDVSFRSDDKSNLRNTIEAVDWVYTHLEGKGFKAYNYIPSVYDFPYQYVYWWHGTKKYGYQPETISYKEGVPEYIPLNTTFLTKTKPQEDNLIAMIYEDDGMTDRIFAWGGDFTKYCRVTDIKYRWGTTAEIRRLCQPGEDSPRLEPARK